MSRLLRSLCITLCLFGATIVTVPGHAQGNPSQQAGISDIATATDQNNSAVITTRLVASHHEVTPGQTVQIAWEFKLSPHWHIYWSNAGDSGLPPELKATMPTGSTPPLQLTWPTPKVISIPPVTNYGYEDSVTLTSSYTVPTGLAKGLNLLSFNASFLYCNDICMPGKAEFKLPLVLSTKPVANPAFKASTNLPAVIPGNSNLLAEVNDKTIQLNLPLNLATATTRFVPQDDGIIDDSAPQTLTGNTLSILLDPQATTLPEKLTGILLVNGQGYQFSTPLHQGAPVSSNPSTTAPPVTSNQTDSSMQDASLLGAVFFAFLAGVILNLMPCVLPVLSLKLLSLVRHHHGPSRIRHTLAYTLGVVASFWAFAIIITILKHSGAQLGWGFHLQNPIFVGSLMLLLIAVAMNFFGIFELGHTFTRFGGKPGSTRPSLAASAATGILAVVVATPCTVPFMGSAMAYALSNSLAASFIVFTSLGLGMALPFLIAIPFPAVFRWLPKPGNWMTTFRQTLGWPMLATALWLLYVFASQTNQLTTFMLLALALGVALLLWIYGRHPALPLAASIVIFAAGGLYAVGNFNERPQTLIWQPWSSTAVAQARATGNPVFVDFTADWCLTCKVTEATVLNTEKVQKLFAESKTAIFQADWTNQNPEITAELARHNRKGVPLYLLYMPGKEAEILPQLLTPGLLKDKLQPTP